MGMRQTILICASMASFTGYPGDDAGDTGPPPAEFIDCYMCSYQFLVLLVVTQQRGQQRDDPLIQQQGGSSGSTNSTSSLSYTSGAGCEKGRKDKTPVMVLDSCGMGPRGSSRPRKRIPSVSADPMLPWGGLCQADKVALALSLGSCAAADTLAGLCPGTPLSQMTGPLETALVGSPDPMDGKGASPSTGVTVHPQA